MALISWYYQKLFDANYIFLGDLRQSWRKVREYDAGGHENIYSIKHVKLGSMATIMKRNF